MISATIFGFKFLRQSVEHAVLLRWTQGAHGVSERIMFA